MIRSKTKSPFSVSYDDLISSTEKSLTWMKANYPRKVLEGSIKSWTAQHNIAVEKKKLELFKRFKKEPQMDLFNEFEKLR